MLKTFHKSSSTLLFLITGGFLKIYINSEQSGAILSFQPCSKTVGCEVIVDVGQKI